MDELKELKQLLIGEEKEALDDLRQRLDNSKRRTEEIADLLPYAVRQRNAQDGELAHSLQEPVEKCLRKAVRNDSSTFADILFPVMGPAIRRAITETLRGTLQAINKTLDESFSMRGLSWRMESMRTGVPFSDIVLRNTLIYRVEQLFLIQPETGLLMQHVTAPEVPSQDPDAVSAMLTAIQDFASDSFSDGDESEKLSTVNLGEHTLWLAHGPHAVLASAIRGVPPIAMRVQFTEALEKIHRQYNDELSAFDGNPAPLNPAVGILTECFVSKAREETHQGFRISPLFLFIILALLGLVGWWSYNGYQESQRRAELLDLLNQTPGVVVIDHTLEDDALLIEGLKDPYSQLPDTRIASLGYRDDELNYRWHEFQSAEPELALARAQAMTAPPESITLSIDNGQLIASGSASAEWIDRAAFISRLIPGLSGFDASAVTMPDSFLLAQIRAMLNPPEGVHLEVTDRVLSISGAAPNEWLASVRPRLSGLSQLSDIQTHAARPIEIDQIDAAVEELQSLTIYFTQGSFELDPETPSLQRSAGLIRALQGWHLALDEKMQISIAGYTDGTGNLMLNQQLAQQRAESVRQGLIQQRVDPDLLVTTGDISASWDSTGEENPALMRRVTFKVRSDVVSSTDVNR